ncbi:c-type cytochrome [Litorisediminicola beolgyonensis]|uniref:C-type cytochrome n=1 Tax=Litorisediminicola beolgyonensis TaxID=1173614 RepID=A0ABW3ZJN5_9RHOB
MRLMSLCLALALWPIAGLAEADRAFSLAIPEALEDSGFAAYVLPRYALKTGTRITRLPGDAEADAVLGPSGPPVILRGDASWGFDSNGDPDAEAFHDWLTSEIGRETIAAFVPAEGAGFTPPDRDVVTDEVITFTGDAALGAKVSERACGRCHALSAADRMRSIGSTPSFPALRALPNWSERFEGFFALNPHPSFTQVEDVTAPFDPMRPPPIVPVRLTLDEIDHILAYVAEMSAADLGAPVEAR